MNVRTLVSVEAIGLKSRRALLRVFGSLRVEGERVRRIMQTGGVGTYDAEVVANLHALIRTHVHIKLHARAEFAVEVFSEHNASAQLSVGRSEAVEMLRNAESNRRLFHERYDDISRVNRITTEFHLANGAVTAGIHDSHSANFGVRASRGGQNFLLPRINFVLVDVPQFAHDRIQLSRLVAAA